MRKLIYFILFLSLAVLVTQWRAGVRETRAQHRYPPEGQLINVDGVIVHAVVKGSGPDLVLIHGASGNTRDFTFDLVDRLSDRYRVIVFDRAGLGWSDRAGPQFNRVWNTNSESPARQAELLQEAGDELYLHNPIVLGHSYGGAVALAWGISRQSVTSGLVLVSAASNPWPGDLGLLYNVNSTALGGALVVPLISAFAPQSQIDNSVTATFAPQAVPEGYLDYIGADLTLRRNSFRANAQQVNGLRPHVVEMAKQYPNLTLPVEIVHGDLDTVVPLSIHSEPLSKQLPNAKLTVLKGVGHMPHHVDPEAIIEAIDRAAERAGLR